MNNRLSATELLSIGYNSGLTAEEKTEAVVQLTARKEQQAKERQMGLGNPFLNMCEAYDSSTSRREARQQQELLEAKMTRLRELEAKQAAAHEEHARKQKLEEDLQRLKHLEDVEKAGLM